jgi:hypothetical protein
MYRQQQQRASNRGINNNGGSSRGQVDCSAGSGIKCFSRHVSVPIPMPALPFAPISGLFLVRLDTSVEEAGMKKGY